MLKVEGLVKRFGDLTAVNNVAFTVAAGETVGLLGPNGAGKTTTVGMILGLSRPDAGAVFLDGQPLGGDANPAKNRLGFVPQDIALFDNLSARDNLLYVASLYAIPKDRFRLRAGEVLKAVGLEDRAHSRVKTFSGGMKRRLNIAAALLHDPDMLVLDEPTVGIDPQSRNAIFDHLLELKARGKAIVYTTHYMEEAEKLCDRIVIMDRGRVIADDTARGLIRQLDAQERLILELAPDPNSDPNPSWLPGVKELPDVTECAWTPDTGVLTLEVRRLAPAVRALLDLLAAADVEVRHLSSRPIDLETVFLNLTGRSLRDE